MQIKDADKNLLEIRNNIFIESGLPTLISSGFKKEPFRSSWFGRNNLGDYTYEFGRLDTDSVFQYIIVHISKGDRWVKVFLNLIKIEPAMDSIELMRSWDSLKFKLPPIKKTEMRISIDDFKGIPLFNWAYMFGGHRLRSYRTSLGLERESKRLARVLTRDLSRMDFYVNRWYEIYKPFVHNWDK